MRNDLTGTHSTTTRPMTLPSTKEQQLSELIGCTIEQLDISVDDFQAAEQRYLDLAKHLADKGADVYVQGSFLLGTVIAPNGRWGEYDLDLVCLWSIAKRSITQQQLKDRTGEHLDEYMEETEGIDGEVPNDCTDSRRAWTLHYDRFHLDVLPAIPDAAACSETAIELTDKQLHAWQKSDPLAYVEWFRRQCAQQFFAARKALAAEAGGRVDDVPASRVRTPLHRVVQVLKRHRDVYFHADAEDRPPSMLITTLAALAYNGQQDLLTALREVVRDMTAFIENRNGVYWVPSPVCEENYADKWADYPQRRGNFERWLKQVATDLEGLLAETGGRVAVHERLKKSLGSVPVEKAAGVLAGRTRELRETGKLKVTTAGLLTTGAGVPARDHAFFGGPAPA